MIVGEIFVVFFSAFLCFYLIVKYLSGKRSSKYPYPPSLPSLPLIGSLPFLRNFSNIPVFFMEKSMQLGPIFTFKVGSRLVLTLNNKEVINEALLKNSRLFSSRPPIFVEKFVNKGNRGIAFMDSTPHWKNNHKTALTIVKEFGFGIKNLMEERILREVEAMVHYVQMKRGKSFEPLQLSVQVASNLIMSIVFGQRRDYELGLSKVVTMTNQWSDMVSMVFDVAPFLQYIPPYNWKLAKIAELSKSIYDTVETKIDKSLKDEANCFVRRYVDKEGPKYDREQLNFMIRDLIAGGTDTMSNTIQWIRVVLANNPEVQKRLHSESDSVLPRNRFPSLQDQSKLPYHEATILELSRWRTLASLAVAHLTTEDSVVRGYFIPSGTVVLPNLWTAHNNHLDWKDPNDFRPERFLDNENNVTCKDDIIPFGLGRRSCFGEILARAEVFQIFASIVQRFNVLPPEGLEKVNDDPKLPVTITTSPNPFSIRLIERE